MILLIVRDHIKKKDQEFKFDNAEDADLYKRYHLKFGNWCKSGTWKYEDELAPEELIFVADEITEQRKGIVKRKFYVVPGIEILKQTITQEIDVINCWKVLRANRNEALKQSDWTQLADVVMKTEERTSWRKYREYLRHLPKMHSDESICGADVLSFEEWSLRVR